MECPICFEEKELFSLTCSHQLCSTCLKDIYTLFKECPFCRNPISFRVVLFLRFLGCCFKQRQFKQKRLES